MFREVFRLLGKKNIKYLYLILFMNLVGVFLEAIGIGSVLPLILTITEDNIYEKYTQFNFIFEVLNYPEKKILIFYSIIFFISIFFIKNIFLGIFTIINNKFVYGLNIELSNSLFQRYLNYSYEDFIKQNPGKLMRNILNEVNQFTMGVMMSLISIITELALFIVVFWILVSYEPQGTLAIFITMSLVFLIIYMPLKKRLKIWGQIRQENEGLKVDILNQGIHGFKDIKIYNLENVFVQNFEKFNSKAVSLVRNQATYAMLPKYLFEFFSILSISFLLMYLVSKNSELSQITAVLGLYAASIFRLMPSFNRILGSLQNLRFANPVLINLYNIFNETEKSNNLAKEYKKNINSNNFSFNNYIEFNKINFSYGEKRIFENLSIKIHKNDFIGILGDSGSGKSTFVDIFCSLLTPQSGEIIVDGKFDISKNINKKNWQKIISYVPQKVSIFTESIYQNITLNNKNEKNDKRFQETIEKCNLKKLIDSLKNKENTVIGSGEIGLSGGQIQRIGLARAIYKQPEILILDEATNALDELNENMILELINSLKEKMTILIVTHKKSLLKNCNKVVAVKNNCIENENI